MKLERIEIPDFRLTTAEILYHMPDFPGLLQTFIWQTDDVAPHFPRIVRFLDFWTHSLIGTLHSVTIAQAGPSSQMRWTFAEGEFTIH